VETPAGSASEVIGVHPGGGAVEKEPEGEVVERVMVVKEVSGEGFPKLSLNSTESSPDDCPCPALKVLGRVVKFMEAMLPGEMVMLSTASVHPLSGFSSPVML